MTHAPSLARTHAAAAGREVALAVGASLFVALCARLTLPLPFTPVPLTLQNFGVLVVGLALGPRRAFAALVLYLLEGMAGAPVFNPTGPGGIAQLLGPTGGYLLAYPFVAALAGALAGINRQRLSSALALALAGSVLGEALLFLSGVSWFMLVTRLPLGRAVEFALYPFVFAEIIKVLGAAALAPRLARKLRL